MKLNSSDKCNFCMGATREYLTIKDLPILVGVPNNNPQKDCLDFSILMCEDCGLIQEKYSRSLDKKLEKIYLSKKASLSTPLGVGEWGKEMLETFLKDADIHYSPDEVLEVGCAAGGLLFKLFNKGCRNLSCFEPSSLVKKIPELGKNFSPHVYNTFFSSKEVKKQKVEGKYNLIIATNILEHVKDVKDFLKAIHLALKKEGVAIITVPNALFCFEKIDPGLMIHEHLNFFTPKTIEGILSVAGFKTINIKIKKDLLLLKFKKENSFSNKVNRNLFSGVINENEILLRNYVKNLPKVISKFKKIANIYKNNKIGLYGACGSAFNLLSLSNTKELKNLFFIDSDSTKWHKNLFGIPIIPPTELLKRRLNPIFIMPPAFEDDIFEYIVSLNLPQNIEIIKFWNT